MDDCKMLILCVLLRSDSSLPVCLFHVDVENIGSDDIEASVMFTFQNGDGGDGDSVGGFVHCPYSLATEPPHRVSTVKLVFCSQCQRSRRFGSPILGPVTCCQRNILYVMWSGSYYSSFRSIYSDRNAIALTF